MPFMHINLYLMGCTPIIYAYVIISNRFCWESCLIDKINKGSKSLKWWKHEKRIKMEQLDESERCERVWVAVNKGHQWGDVFRAICAWGLTDKSNRSRAPMFATIRLNLVHLLYMQLLEWVVKLIEVHQRVNSVSFQAFGGNFNPLNPGWLKHYLPASLIPPPINVFLFC